MPFAPAIPLGGLAGLRFLDRTRDRQTAAFNASPDVGREVAYFLDRAANVTSASQLVGDRRLLAVVLGAFGLDDDIDKRAFIRKILEEGTLAPGAFANRLVEPAYAEMSRTVGVGDLGGLLGGGATRQEIVARYQERRFELAVGESDIDLRLALNFRREAARIAAGAGTDDAALLGLLGSKPLRQVIETALTLPRQFALIDIDRQVAVLKDRAAQVLGSSSRETLQAPGTIDKLVERFLLNAQLRGGTAGAMVRGSTALSLLQAGALGGAAQAGLFGSNFV